VKDSERDEKIQETYDSVIKIKTALVGLDGQGGLVRQVNNNTKKVNRLNIIIAGLVGSGVLGGGIVGIIKLLTG